LNGLKKNFPTLTHQDKVALIEKGDLNLSQQANLLGISRSSLYYHPHPCPEDIEITHALDRLYTDYPFFGSRSMRWALKDYYGLKVCRERIQRLMREMGLQAIYPKPKTSLPALENKIYPYLLRNLTISQPNQVWSSDITYVRLEREFCYLTVILDWYSRYVVSWELSENLETEFCLRALKTALRGAIPAIHNSDQGSQYTSSPYLNLLETHRVRISMDGRGRCMDNIFTERLWKTVKYEDVYLKNYRTLEEAREGLTRYLTFYNRQRRHQGLGYKTPEEIYHNH